MNRRRHAWRVVSWPIKVFTVVADGRSSEDWTVSAVVSPASASLATSAALARAAAAIAASVADAAVPAVVFLLHRPFAVPAAGVQVPAAAEPFGVPLPASRGADPALDGVSAPAGGSLGLAA